MKKFLPNLCRHLGIRCCSVTGQPGLVCRSRLRNARGRGRGKTKNCKNGKIAACDFCLHIVSSISGARHCFYLSCSGAAQIADHGSDICDVHHEAGCAIELVGVLQYPVVLVLHFTGFAAAQRTMKVDSECSASESCRIFDAQTSTGSDLNSSAGELYKLRQPVSSGQDIAFATRGQDASAASVDDVFERLVKRDGVVEGTMKRDFERCSQIDKLAGAFHVHRAVGSENAENKAAGSEGTRVEEVFAHKGELVVRVEEVTASRPQQDMHGESAAQNRCTRETVARRQTAFAKGSAQFNTIGSPFARGEASLDTLCTEFENNLTH
jgi:hypothetical protein